MADVVTKEATVVLIIDGDRKKFTLPRNAKSILDGALSKNIELPYSCKNGMCCTCKGKLLFGEVKMQQNFSLNKKDLDLGFILTCQAKPSSMEVTINLDDRG